MGDFRIVFGEAQGKQNNFYVRTDGLAAQADTTPDVTDISLLYTNNTSNTGITYFDLRTPQGNNTQPGWFEGKKLKVIFLDDSTRLVRGNQLITSTSDGAQGANTVVDFLFHNSAWLETSRSKNINDVMVLAAADSTAGAAFNVRGRSLLVSANSMTLRRLDGGEAGQRLTILSTAATLTLAAVNSAATGAIVTASDGLATYALAASDAIMLTFFNNRWWETGTRTNTAT